MYGLVVKELNCQRASQAESSKDTSNQPCGGDEEEKKRVLLLMREGSTGKAVSSV